MKTLYKILTLLPFIFLIFSSFADVVFYRESSRGQSVYFHPVNFYLNTAFDTVQNPYYFNQKNIYPNHHKVFERIKDPHRSIKKDGGYSKLFKDEFFGVRAFPNYSLHLIGEGSDFRRLYEWFDAKGASYPKTYAFLLSYTAQFGNEALESSNERDINSHDHIADLYFFDWVGKLLFLNDDFSLFVRDDLQMQAWGSMPVLSLDDKRVYNASSNYIFRPKLFGDDSRVRPFLLTGMQVLAGFSYLSSSQYEISVAQGMAYTDPLKQKGKYATGMFLDLEGDLMASLFLNSTEEMRVRLNIYPGVIQLDDKNDTKFGLTLGYYDQKTWLIGASINMPFNLGFKGSFY